MTITVESDSEVKAMGDESICHSPNCSIQQEDSGIHDDVYSPDTVFQLMQERRVHIAEANKQNANFDIGF